MIAGLKSVIESDCLNFVTVPLCDTYVIVDANALLRELRRQHVVNGYGWSPLKVASIFKSAVENFLSCNIQPIFIFRGLYNRIGTGWFSRLHRLKQSTRTSYCGGDFPTPDDFISRNGNFYDSNLLSSVLDSLNVKYIFSTGYPVSVAAAVAILLDCPLIGIDSEFYVICGNPVFANNDISCKMHYLPISGITFSLVHRAPQDSLHSTESSYFLRAHLYNPSESILSSLPPISCRIFGLLSGDSVIPKLSIPTEMSEKKLRDDSRHCEKPIVTNAFKLAQWIGDVGPSSAIQSVVDLIEDPQLRDHVSECILQYVTTTQLDVIEAFQLLQELECATSSNDFVNETMSNFMNSMKQRKSLSSATSSVRLTDSILKHWPARMLKAYRRGYVCPFLLSSLYCEGGNFFPCLLDYINHLPSSYLKALCVRYVSYGLVYSFERSLGDCQHLCGLKPHTIEIHPVNSEKVKILYLTLQNATLPNFSQQTSGFIFEKFGFSSESRLPLWVNGFALCLSIWYKQKASEDERFQSRYPGDCPFILSACLCAMAACFNAEVEWRDIFEKYESAAREARKETAMPTPFESSLANDGPMIMHIYVEMQNVYSELLALEKLIQGLAYNASSCDDLDPASTSVTFKPQFCIFPSNELFFWLVKYFDALPVTSRNLKATRCWLPRLLTMSVTGNVQAKLRNIVSDLSCLLEHLDRVRVTLPDIPMNSIDLPISTLRNDTCKLFSQTILEGLLERPQKQQEPSDIPLAQLNKYSPASPFLTGIKTGESVLRNVDNSPIPPIPTIKTLTNVSAALAAPGILDKLNRPDWTRKSPNFYAASGDSFNEVLNDFSISQPQLQRNAKTTSKWIRKSSSYADRLKQRVSFQ